MAEALTEYEDAHCRCGQRKDIAWDPASSGHFEGHEMVCQGCAAIDEIEATRQKDRPPGIKFYASLPADFDIKKAREDRAAAMAAELAQRKG